MTKNLLAMLLCAQAIATASAAERYTIDPNHTLPVYEINHFDWSTQRGRFNRVTGKIVLDRAAQTGSMDVTIDVTSIDSGVAKLDEHLLREDFFHAAKYPTMRFQSDRIVFEGDIPKSVPGQFTMLGVTRLALFGSVARDEAGEDSDVDIVVRFDGPATSKRYFGVQFYLEDLLGRRVDLVTDKALRPELRPYIEREAIDV